MRQGRHHQIGQSGRRMGRLTVMDDGRGDVDGEAHRAEFGLVGEESELSGYESNGSSG